MLFSILAILIGTVFWVSGFLYGVKYSHQEIKKAKELSMKHLELLKICIKWLKTPHVIERYIIDNQYKRVAIYGMSYLGDCLEDVLRKAGIEVVCGIDKNAEKLYNSHMPIYKIKDDFPQFDVIIVTAVTFYQQIRQELSDKIDGEIEIVFLEDVLHEKMK